jgi:hypothetical protein
MILAKLKVLIYIIKVEMMLNYLMGFDFNEKL